MTTIRKSFWIGTATAAILGFACAGSADATPARMSADGHAALGAVRLVADPAAKPQSSGAESFIDKMAGRAIGFLGDTSMSQEKKRASFRTLLEDSFDMETIGRFALGKYWKASTPAQRSEYQKLFKSMVIDVYSERFTEYKGQKFETAGARSDENGDAIVKSYIVAPDQPKVQVEWRVRQKNGKYKIVDVVVEGVSMSLTQRSDFSAVIQAGGGDVGVLLTHLKNRG